MKPSQQVAIRKLQALKDRIPQASYLADALSDFARLVNVRPHGQALAGYTIHEVTKALAERMRSTMSDALGELDEYSGKESQPLDALCAAESLLGLAEILDSHFGDRGDLSQKGLTAIGHCIESLSEEYSKGCVEVESALADRIAKLGGKAK